jgi:hypothetical protein
MDMAASRARNDWAPDDAGSPNTGRVSSGLSLTWAVPLLCAAMLLWPAVWNGYPIVFADTGTYLTQAIHRYLGWDRPPFYSLFMAPWHQGTATWPVVMVQSCLTVWVLDLTRRGFGLSPAWLFALVVFLSGAAWLPWMVSELMPDLFTPLLVPLLVMQVFLPARFAVLERIGMFLLTCFMIAAQQSSIALSLALLLILCPLALILGEAPRVLTWQPDRRMFPATPPGHGAPDRRWQDIRQAARDRPVPRRSARCLIPLAAPVLAMLAMAGVNLIGHGRFAVSPFGNVFLLARVIYDGPGMHVLRRDCPAAGWRLCPWLNRFPGTSDEFLWQRTSPIILAGGHKAVSADADAIIREAVLTEPADMLRAAWGNTLEQLLRFDSDDGLNAWEQEAGVPITRDFPASEQLAFRRARQQRGLLGIPAQLLALHRAVAIAGIAAALSLLPLAWARRHVAGLFLLASLLVVPLSAAITGALSTPHDRYQSRIIWLPAAMAFLGVPTLLERRRS